DRLEVMAKTSPGGTGAGPSGAPPSTSPVMKGSPSGPGRGRAGASSERASGGQPRHSLQKTMSR
ncbi:hypothetical protein CRUP_020908, partial [Coryphaenoides rupestris]